jgi:glycerol-3-phosphate dehydrogenase
MNEAAGLVENLGFSLATFPGDDIPRWMYGMGLFMYDALAWKWAHERLSQRDLIAKLPVLSESGVLGGYHYYDAQTDDARLVLRVLRDAVARGGVALNYAKVTGLVKDAKGVVCGVRVLDVSAEGTGRETEVKAKVVVNATGAWADDLRKDVGAAPRMRKIRGSHLTFSRERVPIAEAVSLLHPQDGRAVFAVPWEGVTIFGTTDKDHNESLEREPRIADEEVDYLLACARRAFPSLDVTHGDIIGSYAGVRPVIDSGKKDPSKESREHAVWREDGLLTIAGGKLTTFAVMARDALGAVTDVLGELEPRTHVLEPFEPVTRWPAAVDDATKPRLLGRYGAECKDLALLDASLFTAVGNSRVLWAELVYGARAEGVVHLDDLLLRRARIGFLLPKGGRDQLPKVKTLIQPELGWDDARWSREVQRYEKTWQESYGGK